MTAEDKDSSMYNVFAYSFVSGATTTELFSIDASNGVLTTRRSLDRETQALHQFTVAAYDRKLTSMSSTAVVSIQVRDQMVTNYSNVKTIQVVNQPALSLQCTCNV